MHELIKIRVGKTVERLWRKARGPVKWQPVAMCFFASGVTIAAIPDFLFCGKQSEVPMKQLLIPQEYCKAIFMS